MKTRFWIAGLLLLLIVVTGASYYKMQSGEEDAGNESISQTVAESVEKVPVADINEVGMIEDTSVYDADDPNSIVCFYVTVQKGDAGSDTDHTFEEVNNVVRFMDDTHVINDVYARAIVQVGDESGPLPGMLGYGRDKSNARIRIRGNSSTIMEQKSYKLDLDDEAGLWRGQSNIALNKSAFDVTRIKNKLYFDMLREIEAVPSIRTQFVRLYVKDETAGKTAFEDYGLYTQAEVPGKKYLGNHGLDKEGYLYKAISFYFEPSEALKDFDDPEFKQDSFDTILNCKGQKDNEKLIELVEMINDYSIDINEIIGNYIDRENYITWLAYNILLANIDTTVQNFYLYSPVNSNKWFFIPWDGDNMLHCREDAMEGIDTSNGKWEHGISNYWGVILHQRFLKNSANREELKKKVEELHETINKESVDALVKQYNQTVEPYVTAMPDFYYLGHTKEERNQILLGLGEEVEESYQAFLNSLNELMPYYQYGLEQKGNKLHLSWGEAYDFANHSITYELKVSSYPDMRKPVIHEKGLTTTEYETTKKTLSSGTWYWQVTAHTDDGRTSEAMNKIQVNDTYYPGVDILEVR